jgi:hypothetical protein
MMRVMKLTSLLSLALVSAFSLNAQQPAPTSGDITVKLAEPLNFATAIPLQNVRSVVTDTTNPAIPTGSLAVLQLQTLDGSYTLKMMGLNVGGRIVTTTSKAGVSMGGSPASGKNASLANGAVLKFTLTDAAGNPGQPVGRAAAQPTAPAPAAVASKSSVQPEFVLEGIGLGMTKAQVLEAGKAHGSVRGLTPAPAGGYLQMKTSDLLFKSVQFNDAGLVSSYTVEALNPKHLKVGPQAGPLYDMAVASFGQPKLDGSEAKWGSEEKGMANALYEYDKSEGPNGHLIVINGLD